MCADERVGGSRGKLDRCDGAVFDVKSKAKETSSCMLAILDARMKGYRSLLWTYAMLWGSPRMQVQELCVLRLPSLFIRIQV